MIERDWCAQMFVETKGLWVAVSKGIYLKEKAANSFD
jgi:hypothetical protein